MKKILLLISVFALTSYIVAMTEKKAVLGPISSIEAVLAELKEKGHDLPKEWNATYASKKSVVIVFNDDKTVVLWYPDKVKAIARVEDDKVDITYVK